uniref:DUF4773 domain-containing protein n=1 Tax=Timema shepardi TaxID=629360 RepID=A0A7R9B3M4_TIMSH|nr:unnamed protein product [Timema shepardi]
MYERYPVVSVKVLITRLWTLSVQSYACARNMKRFNYLPVLFLCLQLAQTVSILGEYHELTDQLPASVVPLSAAGSDCQHLGIYHNGRLFTLLPCVDLLSWNLDAREEDTSVQRDSESSAPINLKTCNCEGPTCRCCVDFNLTYVDLGGPGARPDPTCMDILSDLAQMCARFVDLAPTSDGLRWCLQIEPTLLGEVQAEYHVGCFRMDPKGMDLDPAYNSSARPAQTRYSPHRVPSLQASNRLECRPWDVKQLSFNTTSASANYATEAGSEIKVFYICLSSEPSDEEATTETINEEALLEAVNESAEQGIAFFSNLLSLTLGNLSNDTVVENSTSSVTTTPVTVADTEGRRAGRGHLLVAHSATNEVV